jgi:precorrin-2 dehydrogenase/sirohydrochlorin ferrochelatase
MTSDYARLIGVIDTTEMGYVVNLLLDGKPAVVVGGGSVAARKVEDLLVAKATVRVVAIEVCAELRSLADRGRVSGEWRSYVAGDLDGAFLAIAATDDESVNARVAADAQARNILVNVVDRPALCTFTLPAVGRRGNLTFAVATDGLCPSLAGALRNEIMDRYGPEYTELVSLFGKLREQMNAMGWDGRRIKGAVSEIYQAGIAQVISAGDRSLLEKFLRTKLGPEFQLPSDIVVADPDQQPRTVRRDYSE